MRSSSHSSLRDRSRMAESSATRLPVDRMRVDFQPVADVKWDRHGEQAGNTVEAYLDEYGGRAEQSIERQRKQPRREF